MQDIQQENYSNIKVRVEAKKNAFNNGLFKIIVFSCMVSQIMNLNKKNRESFTKTATSSAAMLEKVFEAK